jgi:hypothetical protein
MIMMDKELMSRLKYIHLNGLLANWDQYLKLARDKNFSHIRFLKYIIEQEYTIKKENSRKIRLNRAKIQERYVMETFPFEKQPKLNKKKILSIYDSLDYMRKNQNIIWIGPTGVENRV